jgi:hypothetical protein
VSVVTVRDVRAVAVGASLIRDVGMARSGCMPVRVKWRGLVWRDG